MIVDTVSNAESCFSRHPLFRDAFAFIGRCVSEPPAPGRYELQGDRLYANVIEYEPSAGADPKFEAHREYIDVQVMISGTEVQGYAPVDSLEACTEYDADDDFQLYSFDPSLSRITLREGMFAVYFPEDGHIPKLACPAEGSCRRIVVKVKV